MEAVGSTAEVGNAVTTTETCDPKCSDCGACRQQGEQVTGAALADGEEEPSPKEHLQTIAAGTVASGMAYGLCRLLLPTDYTEDVVDMAHSLATSSVAIYGLASMDAHPLHDRSLPPRLASGRGPIVRMFCYSLGYFGADVAKIAMDVLIRNRFPHLWAGRLAHHFVQLGANAPGIFGRGKPAELKLAWRSVLCMAYIAEVSSIFLRLSNLARRGKAGVRVRQAVNWALVVSFFGSRVVNFAFAIAMFVRARPVLPPHLFRLGTTVQVGGYTLSAVWFTKIVQIALKTTLADQTSLPSVEC